MITEQQVRDVLALMPDGFIRTYCNYAEQQVSSHLGYHLATALTLAAVTAPRDLTGHGFKAPTHGNMYALIVGSSGDAEKTLAINVGLAVMAGAMPSLLGPDPTAEETLTKILATRPSQLFVYPELAMFLSKTAGGTSNQRGNSLRDAFVGVFDGFSYNREYSKGQVVEVDNPRVSFLGACTPRHLEDYTVGLDWEGGFLNRFFIMFGERERDLAAPTPMPDVATWLSGYLAWSATQESTAKCLGLTDEAKVRWLQWKVAVYRKHEKRLQDERAKGLVARSRLVTAKLATLLSWSSMKATQPWWIDVDILNAAIAAAELHLESALALVERIAPTHEMREQRQVLKAVGDGEWVALGEILRRCNLPLRRAKVYIDTLLEMGLITTTQQDTTVYYRAVKDGCARPYDSVGAPPPPPVPPPVVPLKSEETSSSSAQAGTPWVSTASSDEESSGELWWTAPSDWAPPPPPPPP